MHLRRSDSPWPVTPMNAHQALAAGLDRRLQRAAAAQRDVPLDHVDEVVELDRVDVVDAEPLERAVDLLLGLRVGALAGLGREEELVLRQPRGDPQLRVAVGGGDVDVVDAVLEQQLERAVRVLLGRLGQRRGTEDHAAGLVSGRAEGGALDHGREGTWEECAVSLSSSSPWSGAAASRSARPVAAKTPVPTATAAPSASPASVELLTLLRDATQDRARLCEPAGEGAGAGDRRRVLRLRRGRRRRMAAVRDARGHARALRPGAPGAARPIRGTECSIRRWARGTRPEGRIWFGRDGRRTVLIWTNDSDRIVGTIRSTGSRPDEVCAIWRVGRLVLDRGARRSVSCSGVSPGRGCSGRANVTVVLCAAVEPAALGHHQRGALDVDRDDRRAGGERELGDAGAVALRARRRGCPAGTAGRCGPRAGARPPRRGRAAGRRRGRTGTC